MILTPRSIGVICSSTITNFLLHALGVSQADALGGWASWRSPPCCLATTPGSELWRADSDPDGGCPGRWLFFVILLTGHRARDRPARVEQRLHRADALRRSPRSPGSGGCSRYVGGAVGIAVTTLILHVSGSPATGFRVTFLTFGLVLLGDGAAGVPHADRESRRGEALTHSWRPSRPAGHQATGHRQTHGRSGPTCGCGTAHPSSQAVRVLRPDGCVHVPHYAARTQRSTRPRR